MTRFVTTVVLLVIVVANSVVGDVGGNSTQAEHRSVPVELIGIIRSKSSDAPKIILSSVIPAKVESKAALPSSAPSVHATNASKMIISENKNETASKLASTSLAPVVIETKIGVVDTVVSKVQSLFCSLASLLHIGKCTNISSHGNATVPQNASLPAVSDTDKSIPLVVSPTHALIPPIRKNASLPISNATVFNPDPKQISRKIAPSSVVFLANDTQKKSVSSSPSLGVSNENATLSALAPVAKTQLIASNGSDIDLPVKKVITLSSGEILTQLAPNAKLNDSGKSKNASTKAIKLLQPSSMPEVSKQLTEDSNVLPDIVPAETNSNISNDPHAKQ
uniref:Secreted protein n=1 Tax=Panagrellus redivivus TaxID=6233 RepID=A0A7E4V8T7_PANRE